MSDPRFMQFVERTQPDLWARAQEAARQTLIDRGRETGDPLPMDDHQAAIRARDAVLSEAKWYA